MRKVGSEHLHKHLMAGAVGGLTRSASRMVQPLMPINSRKGFCRKLAERMLIGDQPSKGPGLGSTPMRIDVQGLTQRRSGRVSTSRSGPDALAPVRNGSQDGLRAP